MLLVLLLYRGVSHHQFGSLNLVEKSHALASMNYKKKGPKGADVSVDIISWTSLVNNKNGPAVTGAHISWTSLVNKNKNAPTVAEDIVHIISW